ncbi:MAG: TrkA family potassium uptake protein [Pyrodictiaceae archaeon]
MRILIVGAGKVGSLLAKSLSEKGHDVIVVEKDEAKAEALSREADVKVYNSDATDPALYESEIDLSTIDIVVATTNRDEVNMLIAMLAREYNVPRIIVKVRDTKIAYIIEKLGIESIIVEPNITANMILGVIEGKKTVVELLPSFSGYYKIVSFTISEQDYAFRKTLDEINYPRNAAKILAIFDGEEFRDPEEIGLLEKGYEVIALVREDMIEDFIKAFR